MSAHREKERLLAYALYQIRILLAPHLGSMNASPSEVRTAAHLAYALHNEALAILHGDTFNLDDALAKLDAINGVLGSEDGSFFRQQFLDELAATR